MSNKLGPIDITCDAPSYSVVRACEWLGFQAPLDVRWVQLSHFLAERRVPGAANGFLAWKWFFGAGQPEGHTCSCGEPLPILENYAFTFACDRVANFHLGQCRRCRTVFWE